MFDNFLRLDKECPSFFVLYEKSNLENEKRKALFTEIAVFINNSNNSFAKTYLPGMFFK